MRIEKRDPRENLIVEPKRIESALVPDVHILQRRPGGTALSGRWGRRRRRIGRLAGPRLLVNRGSGAPRRSCGGRRLRRHGRLRRRSGCGILRRRRAGPRHRQRPRGREHGCSSQYNDQSPQFHVRFLLEELKINSMPAFRATRVLTKKFISSSTNSSRAHTILSLTRDAPFRRAHE